MINMKRYFRIAKRNVNVTKPYKEISHEEFDDYVMNSPYMEDLLLAIPEDIDNIDNITNDIIEHGFNNANYDALSSHGFDCGDYHLYISEDEDINEYDFGRR